MTAPRPEDVSKCAVCGKPATCIGAYELATVEEPACDECCGHGNEDGHCRPVSATPPDQEDYDRQLREHIANGSWERPTPEKDSAAELFWRELDQLGEFHVADLARALAAALAEARKPAPAQEIKDGLTEERAREMASQYATRLRGDMCRCPEKPEQDAEVCEDCIASLLLPYLLAVDAAARKDHEPGWICKARVSATDPPQECDWPHCGCDPHAEKVLEALDESGAFVPRKDHEELVAALGHVLWRTHLSSDGCEACVRVETVVTKICGGELRR